MPVLPLPEDILWRALGPQEALLPGPPLYASEKAKGPDCLYFVLEDSRPTRPRRETYGLPSPPESKHNAKREPCIACGEACIACHKGVYLNQAEGH